MNRTRVVGSISRKIFVTYFQIGAKKISFCKRCGCTAFLTKTSITMVFVNYKIFIVAKIIIDTLSFAGVIQSCSTNATEFCILAELFIST